RDRPHRGAPPDGRALRSGPARFCGTQPLDGRGRQPCRRRWPDRRVRRDRLDGPVVAGPGRRRCQQDDNPRAVARRTLPVALPRRRPRGATGPMIARRAFKQVWIGAALVALVGGATVAASALSYVKSFPTAASRLQI